MNPRPPVRLLTELKRRGVFRVAAIYAAVAWIVVEVGEVVLPRLQLPDWTVTFLVVLSILGFSFLSSCRGATK